MRETSGPDKATPVAKIPPPPPPQPDPKLITYIERSQRGSVEKKRS